MLLLKLYKHHNNNNNIQIETAFIIYKNHNMKYPKQI